MFNVYARIKHSDGQIEERRLWLENLSQEEAERQAQLAVTTNPDDGSGRAVVLHAWVTQMIGSHSDADEKAA